MRLIVLTVITSLIAIATPAQASAPILTMEARVAAMPAKQQARFAIGMLVNSKSETDCAVKIAFKESRYRLKAKNKHSSARGVWQLMWGQPHWSIFKQASEANKYVQHRYGSWCKAYRFHQERNWF